MLLYFYQKTQYIVQSEQNNANKFSGIVADHSVR